MRLLSLLGALFIRSLHSTLRVRHVDETNMTSLPQYILSFWHGHLLLMLHSKFKQPISVMSSRSRDGEIIAGVFRYYGVAVARGSSSRGASAVLREQIRRAQNGYSIVFTPDGPVGPPRVAKDGIVAAAQLTGLPVVPAAFAAKKKSSSAPGTGWSCHIRLRARFSCTVSPSAFRAKRTARNGA